MMGTDMPCRAAAWLVLANTKCGGCRASVACELLDLTARTTYQRNEIVKRNKMQQCAQQFIITQEGTTYPDIKDLPPFVPELPCPAPFHLAMSVAVCTQGQRDGVQRLHLKQLLEQMPMSDLSAEDNKECPYVYGDVATNNIALPDILTVIDGILWTALHSKTMKSQLQYYAKEEIPTSSELKKALETGDQPRLSKRVTSSICDAIVEQAISDVYSLEPKHHMEILKLQ